MPEARLLCWNERAAVPRSLRNKVLVTHKHSRLPAQGLNPGFLTHRQPLPCLPRGSELPPAPRRGLDCGVGGRGASPSPLPECLLPGTSLQRPTCTVAPGALPAAGPSPRLLSCQLRVFVKLLNLPGLHLLVCEEKIMEIPIALGGCAACRRDAQEVWVHTQQTAALGAGCAPMACVCGAETARALDGRKRQMLGRAGCFLPGGHCPALETL